MKYLVGEWTLLLNWGDKEYSTNEGVYTFHKDGTVTSVINGVSHMSVGPTSIWEQNCEIITFTIQGISGLTDATYSGTINGICAAGRMVTHFKGSDNKASTYSNPSSGNSFCLLPVGLSLKSDGT